MEMEFFDPDVKVPWRQAEGAIEGIMEKIVSIDPETGSYTRFLKFPPLETTELALVHDFWEEVYIIKGSLTTSKRRKPILKDGTLAGLRE